jgi:hypothetical protein
MSYFFLLFLCFLRKNVKNLTIVKFIYPNDTIYYSNENIH